MLHRVIYENCGSISEFDSKSVWVSNREYKSVECPVCHHVIRSAYTDIMPEAHIIKRGETV